MKNEIMLIKSDTGFAIYLNDYRIAGKKPRGDLFTKTFFDIETKDILDHLINEEKNEE